MKPLVAFLKSLRKETAAEAIEEDGDWFVAPLQATDGFSDLDDAPVPIDADRSIFALMGTTKDGRKDIQALYFPRESWKRAEVQSWLAEQGLDRKRGKRRADARRVLRFGFERARLEKADVEETDDFWIIKDSVLTKAGVFNAMKRPAAVLEKAWRLYDGVPITHPHPPDIVQDFTHVAGQVRNVRYEAESTRVIGDYYLAKHPNVDGLQVDAVNVKLNEEAVDRVRAGKGVDNSQGYLFSALQEAGTENGREYEAVMTELVPDHLAILLEQEGACNWEDGCGLARLALECARENTGGTRHGSQRQDRADARRARRPAREAEEGEEESMSGKDCGEDCARVKEVRTKLDAVEQDLTNARKALATIAAHSLMNADKDAKPESVATLVQTALDDLKKRRDADENARKRLAKETAEVAVKLGRKGDADTLAKEYAGWTAEALVEHKTALEALLARKTPGRERLRAREEDAEAEPERRRAGDRANGSRLTVGYPGTDGKWRRGTPERDA